MLCSSMLRQRQLGEGEFAYPKEYLISYLRQSGHPQSHIHNTKNKRNSEDCIYIIHEYTHARTYAYMYRNMHTFRLQ